jgi:type III restriction enzyme
MIKEELEIDSVDDLQKSSLLGDFDIKIIISKNQSYDDISNHDKLNIVLKFLENVFAELKDTINPKIGSEFIAGDFKKFFNDPKTKIIEFDPDSERIAKYLEQENWYVMDSFYGTSKEKELIDFSNSRFEQKHMWETVKFFYIS